MSFLFKKIAAQDLSVVSAATDAAEYRVVHANIVRDECEGDDVAQDSLPTVGGYITLKKDGKKYKILKDWGGGEYIVADPNGGDFQVKYYEHLEGLKHYGEDAAQFKVGDKIWVDPSYGANLNIGYGWNVGIVKRVGTGNIDVDFKGQVISVPAPYCARVNSSGKPVFDSAAMDLTEEEIAMKNALGGIFGKYKHEVIEFAKNKRDEYQLEMNRVASKLTNNGNSGSMLKAAQAGIRKIYEDVYSENGVKIQW